VTWGWKKKGCRKKRRDEIVSDARKKKSETKIGALQRNREEAPDKGKAKIRVVHGAKKNLRRGDILCDGVEGGDGLRKAGIWGLRHVYSISKKKQEPTPLKNSRVGVDL